MVVFLLLDTINAKGEQQRFTIARPSLEMVLNSASGLTGNECILKGACLVDNHNKPIPLPIEVVDGDPMREETHTLKREWEQVLLD